MTRASDRLPGETAVEAVLRAAGLSDFLSIRYGTELWDRVQAARETDWHEAEERRLALRRAEDFDNGLCPALYRDTDPARLPEAAARVLGHAYGPKGLLAHGPTGRGKTRAMWLLLRRLHVVEGKSLAYRDALEFAEEAVAAYRGNLARAWVDRLVGVGVFFLDDLGKARITQRVGEALFAVIDRRAMRGRPTYLTTNFVGETLKLRLDDQETADPLVRRLKEFFTPDLVLSMGGIRFIPGHEPAPRSRWRPIADRMVAEQAAAVVDTLDDARALGVTLRRLGVRPARRKLDGEGWEVSFLPPGQNPVSSSS